MWETLKHGKRIRQLIEQTESIIARRFAEMAETVEFNQWKVIRAFRKYEVSDFHFASSTGYGYNDRGREVLDLVYADVFGTEAALVRPHIVSGTHAIAIALFGQLRPGDELLYITGKPYDTLEKVIGKPKDYADLQDEASAGSLERDSAGSLADYGVSYDVVPLTPSGKPDFQLIARKITAKTKVIAIQRSRGYDWRPSFTVDEIADMTRFIKEIKPDVVAFVDNCYGEFTEKLEPTQVGVDLMAGSLIKNPGGGIAPSGGYIVGTKRTVLKSANRLTAPGIGGEVGAMLGTNRALFQGFFMAPHIVGEALKGGILTSALLEEFGFATHPRWSDPRSDLIQAIRFGDEKSVILFCEAIQYSSPVDAHVTPVPWEMPGYTNPVIMAAGTFISGGSLELSADAPIRSPYIAYMQGGLTYSHVKIAISEVLDRFIQHGLVK